MSMTPKGYNRYSTLSPDQSNIFSQLQSQLMGQYQPIDKSKLEAPYLRKFNEEIIPGIAERFSGLGAGAQRSSAFGQALGSAGAGLTEALASLGLNADFQREQGANQGLMGLLGLNTEGLMKKEKPWWQEALIGLGGGLGQGVGQGLGSLGTGGMGGIMGILAKLLGLSGNSNQQSGF